MAARCAKRDIGVLSARMFVVSVLWEDKSIVLMTENATRLMAVAKSAARLVLIHSYNLDLRYKCSFVFKVSILNLF